MTRNLLQWFYCPILIFIVITILVCLGWLSGHSNLTNKTRHLDQNFTKTFYEKEFDFSQIVQESCDIHPLPPSSDITTSSLSVSVIEDSPEVVLE
jgi:hypothetical protein